MTQPLQLAPGQTNAEVPINENFNAIADVFLYAYRAEYSTGLIWGYYGGSWGDVDIADGTLTLEDGATNYIVVERATGDISVDTATTDWNDTDNFARVYRVTTAAGAVLVVSSRRLGPGGLLQGAAGSGGGGGGGGSVAVAIALGSGSGDYSTSSGTYSALTGMSVSVPASVGDTVEVTLSLQSYSSSGTGNVFFSLRNAAGTEVAANNSDNPNTFSARIVTWTAPRVVQAGDISGGNAVYTIYWRASGGTQVVVNAGATLPSLSVKNFG